MKIAAIFLIIVGVICLILGATWDTTPTGYVNFHAVSQQQTLLMIGGFTFLGGLVTLGFERMRPRSDQSSESKVQPTGRANANSHQPQLSPTEQSPAGSIPLATVPEGLQIVGKTLSPEYRLRLFVACGVGFPIAYFIYQSAVLYKSSFASIVMIIIAVGYSLIPGDTTRRLTQLFWVATAVCGVLLIDQISFIIDVAEYGLGYIDEILTLLFILALGAAYLGCTKFVGRWVARLQEK